MKFEGWEIDVDLDGAAIHYDANIELIKVAFISSLKKLVFDCDFLFLNFNFVFWPSQTLKFYFSFIPNVT